MKAVLQHKNEDEAKLWGLNSDVSFFRNILYTLAESNLHQRRVRSPNPPADTNGTDEKVSEYLDDILEEVADNKSHGHYEQTAELSEYLEDILEEVTDNTPHGRYGHAADKVPGKKLRHFVQMIFFHDIYKYS